MRMKKQVKIDKKKKKIFYEVDIFIVKSFRRKNIASNVLDLAIKSINTIHGRQKFLAKVKKNNIPSLNFFKKYGFIHFNENNIYVEFIF